MEPVPLHQPSFRFPSAFRLKSRRLIRALFDRSRDDVFSIAAGSIRLLVRPVQKTALPATVPLQVGFTTGRNIRRAVDRNRIKRYMREAYRLNQHELLSALESHPDSALTIMVIFRGHAGRARRQIPLHVPTTLKLLVDKIQQGSIPL